MGAQSLAVIVRYVDGRDLLDGALADFRLRVIGAGRGAAGRHEDREERDHEAYGF
jgi:hypothetical protein